MKCGECKKDFPSKLLRPMFAKGAYTPPICGICALRLRNSIHGLPPDTPFAGEVAHRMYKEALSHLGRKK